MSARLINAQATSLIKVEHCPTLASEVAVVTKAVEECFPGVFNVYGYEHTEQSERLDVTVLPGVVDPDEAVPSDFEEVIVHSRSVTGTLVSEAMGSFVELVKIANERRNN